MAVTLRKLGRWKNTLIFLAILIALYDLATHSEYLLFHTIIELITIAVAACAFIIAWNGQRLHANSYLLVLGLGFGSVAALTLAHAMAYKGMNIIPHADLTLSTQLWIASRGVLALSLLIAPLAIGRRLRRSNVLYVYSMVTALLFASIFVWRIFPITFIEGQGVTLFKTLAEYAICLILAAALVLLWRKAAHFDREVLFYLSGAIVFIIAAELTFSSYLNLYGTSNVIGHLFTLAAFYYVYLAIVRTGFSQPLQLLFRDLKESEQVLRESEERYRSLFSSMAEGFALHEIICDDRGEPIDYRFLEINSAFEHLTGLRREAVIGRTFLEVLPEEASFWIKTYGGVALTGESVRFEHYASSLKRHYEIFAYRPALGQFAVVFRDITERKQAERALQESREDLARAQEVGQIGSWRLDVLRNVLTWSDENHRIFGVPKGTPLSYETFLEIVHPDDREYVDTRWQAGLRGEPYDIEHRLVVAGAVKWVREKAFLEWDEAGNLLGGFGITQDITGRKRGEAALKEAAETWQQTFASVPDQIMVLDREHRILRVNRAMMEAAGTSEAELTGRHCYEIVHGINFPPNFCPHVRLLEDGQAHREEITEPRLGMTLEVSVTPLYDRAGQVIGSVHVAHDITKRKRAEKALQESEQRFKVIASSTPDHVLVQDRELRYSLVVNPQLGLTEEEMIGKTDFDFLPKEDAEKLTAIKRRVLETGDAVHLEVPLISRQGETEFFEGDYVPKYNAEGEIDGLIGYFRNITESKRAGEVLAASETRYRRLFESAKDGILIIDADSGRIIDVNPYLADMLGYSHSELLGKELWEIGVFKDIAASREAFAELQEKKFIRYEDLPLETKTGKIIDVEFVSNVYAVDHAKVIQCNIRNITERKRAEEQMAWLASFPRQNPAPVMELEADGKLVYANSAAQKLLPDLGERGLAHPWLAGWEEVIRRFREGRESGVLRDVQIGDSWYQQLLMPVQEGRRVRIYAADITERKRSGEALLRERNRMRLLADTAAQLLAAADPLAAVNELCREVMEFIGCQMFFNFLVDEKQRKLHLNAYAGIPEATAKEIEWLDYGVAVCGCVAQQGDRIVVEHIPTAGDPRAELVKGLGAKAYACHPIMFQDQVLGTLSFGCSERETFAKEELDLMSIITDQVALAVVRKRGEQALQEAKAELEIRVQERTAQLRQTVDALQVEAVEREQAENAAAAERRRFNDVLETVPAYVVLLTPDYHVAYANRVFRERFGESGGRRCYEFLFQRSEPCEICETYTVLKTKRPHHWEWTGPDGRNYDIFDFPFTDTDGSELILEMGIDITELKVAQQRLLDYKEKLEQLVEARTAALESTNAELLAAERARAQLAETLVSEIGHRTKNNLAIVAGLLQMQMDREGEETPGPELIRDAVTRILSFASLHEQMYQSRADSIELAEALGRIAEIDRQALSAGDVTIAVEGEPVSYPSGVGTTLCVVANELLTNAVKHSGRQDGKRRVEVKLSCQGGLLSLSVWNSGKAITKDFDMRKSGRTGLGLVRAIVVEQYGGLFTLKPYRDGTLAKITLDDKRLREG